MATTASANTSKRQIRSMAGRRPEQQIELFGNEQPGALVDTPRWQDSPAATQIVLTRLMARLILDYAETCKASLMREVGHDL